MKSIFEFFFKGIHDFLITMGASEAVAAYVVFGLFISVIGLFIVGFVKYGLLNRSED